LGVTLADGQQTALLMFTGMQPMPIREAPLEKATARLALEGEQRFDAIGCGECHRPTLELASDLLVLQPGISVQLGRDAAEPRLSGSTVRPYTDLRRHDLGPQLAEARGWHGVAASVYLTPPLWGLARTGPFLHDGRAATLEEAILAHGGEAQRARDTYRRLGDGDRGAVRVFLTTLTLAPRMFAP
jgi:CxxC motif-containing protein (DUF1111 family)